MTYIGVAPIWCGARREDNRTLSLTDVCFQSTDNCTKSPDKERHTQHIHAHVVSHTHV